MCSSAPKLERDASMSLCRNLSAFLGKRCLADQTQDLPSPKASLKPKRRRPAGTICVKDGASAADPSSFTTLTQISILELFSPPLSRDETSAQGLGHGSQASIEGVETGGETLIKSSSCKSSVQMASPCEESPSLQAEMSRMVEMAQNSETKRVPLINNSITEAASAPKHSGTHKLIESSELQESEAMKEDDGEDFVIVSHPELGEPQEQVSNTGLQDIKNFSAFNQELCTEQSKSDCNSEAAQMQAFEDNSGKFSIDQKLYKKVQLVSSGPGAQSPQTERNSEVAHHVVNVCEEICINGISLEEPQPLVCVTFQHGDEEKTVSYEICGSESAQIDITNSYTAEGQKLGCMDTQSLTCPQNKEEGKMVDAEPRRSSRIKKLFSTGEEDITIPTSGSISPYAKEQEESELVVPNSVHINCNNSPKLNQTDFFLPASKRCKRQKVLEETNTRVLDRPVPKEKRPREEKLVQSHKGSAVMNSKLASNNEEFFKPASKKHRQMLNTKPDVRLESMAKEERGERSLLFEFDLWTEAKLAAEENAQLCVGKPTHPFFSQHKGGNGQRASIFVGISASAISSHQASILEEVELLPSPPLHVTQLMEAEVGITDIQQWTSSGIFQNLKVDQASSRRGCFDFTSQELDGLLRIPFVDKLSGTLRQRRNHISQGLLLDNVLEPLLSFLKGFESESKREHKMGEDEFDISLPYLEDRLKACISERAKRCSEVSLDSISGCTDEGGATKNLLWTDVYQPQSPKQVCGNRESVNSLSAWLERWKAGMPGPLEGDTTHRKLSNNEDCDEDRGFFQEDSDNVGNTRGDAPSQNVLFLAGPVGCGKTAAIYACARAHGYTIIEVNCSDNRNGLLIKQKFSESMESHRLGKWSADSTGPGSAPSCIKRDTWAAADTNAATSSHVLEAENTQHVSKQKSRKQKQKQKHTNNATASASNPSNNKTSPNTEIWLALEAEQHDESIECDKLMTVLLFEDVDMVFEDDRGFMAAVAQVAATAKRPIILTSNDKLLCLPPSLGAELLEFERPSTKELVVLAYLICVAEGIQCRPEFLLQMVKLCRHDLRLLLNYLQFWSQGLPEIKDQINVAKVEKEVGMWPDLRSQEVDSAAASKLFNLEAQHRLWPSLVSLRFPCQVTQSVACKLNDKVSQVEKKFDIDEEKELVNCIVEKLALLKKVKRHKVGTLKADREGVDSVCKVSTAEESDSLETPVKNLKVAKAVARSPILREKLKKDLAITMLGSSDGTCPKDTDQAELQTPSKHVSGKGDIHVEPFNIHSPGTGALNDSVSVTVPSPIKSDKTATSLGDTSLQLNEHEISQEVPSSTVDDELESIPHSDVTTGLSQSLTLENRPLKELESDPGDAMIQSISEPIYKLWSEFRNSKEKQGLLLSSTSKEAYATTIFLSKMSDNLSSCDVMSRMHGPKNMVLEGNAHMSSCLESLEDCSMLQACSMFAHKALLSCIQECTAMTKLPEEMITMLSSEDMMLAVNDSCVLGKLVTDDGLHSSGGLQLQNVAPSYQEQEFERCKRKSSLQRALLSELPSKVQVGLQRASFFEYASFLARIGHLEQDRLASGATRRRGRGFQNYLRTHPWDLSKESLNILEQFGRFSRS